VSIDTATQHAQSTTIGIAQNLTAPHPTKGQSIGTDCVLDRPLHTTRCSQVWVGHRRNGHEVVCKFPIWDNPNQQAASLEAISNEAKLLPRVDSDPGIVTLQETVEVDHVPALIIDLAKGESLAQTFKRGRLDWRTVVRIGESAAGSLAYMHEQDVVHRDIKPDNLIVDFEILKVTIVDLGIGQASGHTAVHNNQISGTAHYIAPEILRGKRVGCKSDVYSLCATLHALLMGQPPIKGSETTEIAFNVVRGRKRWLSLDIPEPLRYLIYEGMSLYPNQRLSASDLADALRKIDA
jgi:serine/threonine protein kinase